MRELEVYYQSWTTNQLEQELQFLTDKPYSDKQQELALTEKDFTLMIYTLQERILTVQATLRSRR